MYERRRLQRSQGGMWCLSESLTNFRVQRRSGIGEEMTLNGNSPVVQQGWTAKEELRRRPSTTPSKNVFKMLHQQNYVDGNQYCLQNNI